MYVISKKMCYYFNWNLFQCVVWRCWKWSSYYPSRVCLTHIYLPGIRLLFPIVFRWRGDRESTYHCYDIKHRTFELLKLVQSSRAKPLSVTVLHYIFMKCIRSKIIINGSIVIAVDECERTGVKFGYLRKSYKIYIYFF